MVISELGRKFVNLITIPQPLFLLIFNLLLKVAFLNRFYRWSLLVLKRYPTMVRWRQTSPEELDQAESRILSFLKCKFKSYYVDIGKAWDLDNVRIWTVEIPPVHQAQKQTEAAVLSQSALLPNQNQQSQKSNLQISSNIQSIQVENKNEGLPLVMVHGFAAGVGFWALNFDELSNYGNRAIYAFDILGFAKSSRPKFSFPKMKRMDTSERIKAEAEKMEEYLVESIEKWRKSVGLNQKFILLGHSFGAYLSLAYALRYPDYIGHIILADPWGLAPDTPTPDLSSKHYTSSSQIPFFFKTVAKLFLGKLSPLTPLRALGPFGPGFIKRARPDIQKKFERLTNDLRDAEKQGNEECVAESSKNSKSDEENKGKNDKGNAVEENSMITDYIYHSNAQSRPSGEFAFKKLCTTTAWAHMPMLGRIIELKPHISITFIYGSKSWLDSKSGFLAKDILETSSTQDASKSSDEIKIADDESERVSVLIIEGAGHHVYADMPDEFNQIVLKVSTDVDATHRAKIAFESAAKKIEDEDNFSFNNNDA